MIYRAEGVCSVSDIREESFGTIGGKEKYYILSPVNDEKSTLFVPLNNERLCGMMRKLLSAEDICALCKELYDERLDWIPENRARNAAFRDILAIGDRRELIVLVNTVCERMESGKITGTDENTLRRATKMLYDEFKVTSDIASESNVIPLLRGELTLNAKI